MTDLSCTLNTTQIMGSCNYMTTIDIKQDISILWNRGVIVNIQQMENKHIHLRFYDL